MGTRQGGYVTGQRDRHLPAPRKTPEGPRAWRGLLPPDVTRPCGPQWPVPWPSTCWSEEGGLQCTPPHTHTPPLQPHRSWAGVLEVLLTFFR